MTTIDDYPNISQYITKIEMIIGDNTTKIDNQNHHEIIIIIGDFGDGYYYYNYYYYYYW